MIYRACIFIRPLQRLASESSSVEASSSGKYTKICDAESRNHIASIWNWLALLRTYTIFQSAQQGS